MTVLHHALCGDDFHQTLVSTVITGKCSELFFFLFCGRCNTGGLFRLLRLCRMLPISKRTQSVELTAGVWVTTIKTFQRKHKRQAHRHRSSAANMAANRRRQQHALPKHHARKLQGKKGREGERVFWQNIGSNPGRLLPSQVKKEGRIPPSIGPVVPLHTLRGCCFIK